MNDEPFGMFDVVRLSRAVEMKLETLVDRLEYCG